MLELEEGPLFIQHVLIACPQSARNWGRSWGYRRTTVKVKSLLLFSVFLVGILSAAAFEDGSVDSVPMASILRKAT